MRFLNNYKIHLFVLLGLIILNLAFFSFNLNDFFVSDDFDLIHVSNFEEYSVLDFFTANDHGLQGEGGKYRPMYNLVFWLNYQFWQLNPLGYHIFNLIFHIGVCFLVYLLALQLFAGLKSKNKIAILSAVFFSILPNHSEAVIWISAIGDPMGTFFYLLSFYLYILFRRNKNFALLLISLLSFIVALLTKEFTITLPLLIFVWELYKAVSKWKFKWFKIFYLPLGYLILIIGYLLIRFKVLGIFIGYYAADHVSLNIKNIYTMMVSLVVNQLFYGDIRVILTNFFVQWWWLFIILIIIFVGLILFILRKHLFKAAFLIDFFIITMLPALLVNFNQFTDEGERYGYLPSVGGCLLLGFLIWQIRQKYLKYFVAGVLIIYFGFFLVNKNLNWEQAAGISNQIIDQIADYRLLITDDMEKVLFVGIPDNYEGAQVMRNGLKQAVSLFYPDYQGKITVLNAYLRLTKENKDQQILNWQAHEVGGYLAQTTDKDNWVTGFDRKEIDNYIFELWDYNYENYTTDKIRLIIKDEQDNKVKAGDEDVNIIIFNKGNLQNLN